MITAAAWSGHGSESVCAKRRAHPGVRARRNPARSRSGGGLDHPRSCCRRRAEEPPAWGAACAVSSPCSEHSALRRSGDEAPAPSADCRQKMPEGRSRSSREARGCSCLSMKRRASPRQHGCRGRHQLRSSHGRALILDAGSELRARPLSSVFASSPRPQSDGRPDGPGDFRASRCAIAHWAQIREG